MGSYSCQFVARSFDQQRGRLGLSFCVDRDSIVEVLDFTPRRPCEMKLFRMLTLALFVSALVVAAPATTGMTVGKVDVKSAGPLAFGPDGVLFIGDSLGAK